MSTDSGDSPGLFFVSLGYIVSQLSLSHTHWHSQHLRVFNRSEFVFGSFLFFLNLFLGVRLVGGDFKN